jgi:hypothetical protein
VTGPRKPLRRHAAVARSAMAQLRAITNEAAKDNDAGTLGVDGWIRTGHRLIDLQVRTFAGFLQASMAGPWWAEPPSSDPLPSEPIPVPTEAQIPGTTITIAEPFVRVGLPRVTIPNNVIKFLPDVLSSGQQSFQIALKDYDYVGANYTGKVRLSAPGKPDEVVPVTVGL